MSDNRVKSLLRRDKRKVGEFKKQKAKSKIDYESDSEGSDLDEVEKSSADVIKKLAEINTAYLNKKYKSAIELCSELLEQSKVSDLHFTAVDYKRFTDVIDHLKDLGYTIVLNDANQTEINSSYINSKLSSIEPSDSPESTSIESLVASGPKVGSVYSLFKVFSEQTLNIHIKPTKPGILNSDIHVPDFPKSIQDAGSLEWSKDRIPQGTVLYRFTGKHDGTKTDAQSEQRIGQWYITEIEFNLLRDLVHARLEDPTGAQGLITEIYKEAQRKNELAHDNGEYYIRDDFLKPYREGENLKEHTDKLLSGFLGAAASMLSAFRSATAVPKDWNPFTGLERVVLTQDVYGFVSTVAPQKEIKEDSTLPGGLTQVYIPNLTTAHIEIQDFASDELDHETKKKLAHLKRLEKYLTTSHLDDPELPKLSEKEKIIFKDFAEGLSHKLAIAEKLNRGLHVVMASVAINKLVKKQEPEAEDLHPLRKT